MAKILIIVENLTVPLDRRVWQQATALTRAGFTVSVICPKGGRYQDKYELRDGVHIFRHSLPLEASSVAGYLIEYVWSWFAELYLAIKIYRKIGFDVIQACNPPDTIFAIALMFRSLCKTKFIFDHHDPFAALFKVKFPNSKILNFLPHLAERWSLRTADQVITTSEELRKLAVNTHGTRPDKVHLIRSGINLRNLPQAVVNPNLKHGRRFLCLYIGVMGVQDGLDLLLHAVAHIVHHHKRQDVGLALLGSGTEVAALKTLAKTLDIEAQIEFAGHLEGAEFLSYLATADIGLCPDPKNEFNDKLSMNKVLEYMAFGLPVVQFDLNEGRFIAQDASVYATDNNPLFFAQAILDVLDDPVKTCQMGDAGKRRIAEHFAWDRQEKDYVALYKKLLAHQ